MQDEQSNIKKFAVTVGIPVYNEEKNITQLLMSLLQQKGEQFYIDQIVISSDGSTDQTIQKIKLVADTHKRVKVIENKKRMGIARGLNQIVYEASGDILVLLDGDIRILDMQFVEKLIAPIIEKKADLTSASISEAKPKTVFAQILLVSMKLKSKLFKELNHGNNIYTCHGLARAFSARFYKTLRFPISIGNDMYSYLLCISQGLTYLYVPQAVVWYQLPDNFVDHQKQSTRFFVTEKEQSKIFSDEFIKSHTKIPYSMYLKAAFKALPILLQYPFHVIGYVFIQLYMKIKSSTMSQKETWDIAVSSKSI